MYNQCHWQEQTVAFLCFRPSCLWGERLCWGFWSCVEGLWSCVGSAFGIGMTLGGIVFSECLDCWVFIRSCRSDWLTVCCRWAEFRQLAAKSLWECVSLVRDERVRGKENMSVVSRGGSWSWLRMSPSALVLSAVSVLSFCSVFLCLFSFSFLTHTQTTYLFCWLPFTPTLHSPFVPLEKLLSGFCAVLGKVSTENCIYLAHCI